MFGPMSAAHATPPSPFEDEGNPYIGWIAGLVVIVGVLAVGAALWIKFHGL